MKKILACLFLLFANPVFAQIQPVVEFQTFGIYLVEYEGKEMVFFRGSMELYSSVMIIDTMETVDTNNLLIDSTGGLLTESIVLGEYIDKEDIDVYIPENGVCVSGCAFAAMRSDYIENNGKGLFFHAPYLPFIDATMSINDLMTENQSMMLEITEMFIESGYSIDFMKLIFRSSDRNTFIVFEDPTKLQELKVDEFSQKVEIKPEWFKIEER